jgi:HD-like signal output (HDOD) protein
MPMLPALAADVMSLAIDPEVSIARIARVIAKDQVLATRVLKLANSAYCAPMQEITTVNDAIVRMGTGPVRNVVLAVCFTSRLPGANVYGTQGRELMDHAIGTAYLARLVAEKLNVDADEAFMRVAPRSRQTAVAEAAARLHQVRRAYTVNAGDRRGL